VGGKPTGKWGQEPSQISCPALTGFNLLNKIQDYFTIDAWHAMPWHAMQHGLKAMILLDPNLL